MKTYKHQWMCRTVKHLPKSWVIALSVTLKKPREALPLEQTSETMCMLQPSAPRSPDTEEPSRKPKWFLCLTGPDWSLLSTLSTVPFFWVGARLGFVVVVCFSYLSMSLTRLWRRSLRSKILMSRISMALWISESMRSRSSRELFKFCSEFWMRRSSSELRISVSCRREGAKKKNKNVKGPYIVQN